jgi:hypothetical protein
VIDLGDVRRAAARIDGVAHRTPVITGGNVTASRFAELVT